MLDAKLIRADPDGVRAALERRGGDAAAEIDRFLALDAERLELLQQVEATRAERNAAARAIAEAKGRGEDAAAEIARQSELKQSQSEGEAALAAVEAGITEIMLVLPNLPHPSAPLGDTEEDAEVVRVHGSPPEFRVRAARPPRPGRARGPGPDRPGGGGAGVGQPLPLPARRPRAARVRAHAVGPREAARARLHAR